MSLPYIGPAAARDAIYGVGGIDAATVLNFDNQNGITPEAMITRAAAAIGTANEALVNKWSPFLFFTYEQTVRYREGGSSRKTPLGTEFVPGDGVRGQRNGHMLPINPHKDGLAWSQMYLKTAYDSQVDADIQELVDSWYLRVDSDMVNRLFSNHELPVGGGYSAGWANPDAANTSYVPPAYGAHTFDNTHTHYQYKDGAANASNFKAELNKAVKNLREHGIGGRLVALVSDADVDAWVGVSGFVEMMPGDFRYVTGGTEALQVTDGEFSGMAGERFGYVNTTRGVVELRYMEQVPTGYFWVGRSYGTNNPNNALAVRLYPNDAFGLRPAVMVSRSMTPQIETIEVTAFHGVGVNKRLNGVAAYIKTGASAYVWTDV
jgi:hypothetical protein